MEEKIYEDVHNYTKYKLVEMLIEKYKDVNLDNLNLIEKVSDDVLKVLSIAGLKYHQELKNKFEQEGE